VTSKADDFDVRYDNAGRGRHRGTGSTAGTGAAPGNVDYDLGYGDNGWDTQGFRTPNGGHRRSRRDDNFGPPTEAYNPVERDLITSPARPGPMGPGSMGPAPMPPGPLAPGPMAPRRSHRGGGPGGPGGPGGRPDKVKIKGSWWRHWTWRKALGLALGLGGALAILLAVVVAYIYNATPVPTEQMAAVNFQESTVYAADGKTVIGRFGNTNRQVMNYNQIPTKIIDSVLAAEDRNFFNEGGISPTGIMRAAYADVTSSGNSLQGGSTITQEFVRNYYNGIGTAQTASRKIKEIFVAMKIAKDKSKQWILENYLNTIYLGEGSYGIGAAASTYFDIPVSKLSTITWSQAALLAAVIQQPSTYPLPQFKSNFEARWHYVLSGLVKMGDLTQAQASAMQFPAFGDHVPQAYGSKVWDPYVMDVVKHELMDVYGYTQSQLFNNGYKIVTTIDPAKEAALYDAVISEENQINATSAPMQKYMHVGAVLENPQNSAIEAMYPGPGYPGYKYNGTGKKITQKLCNEINCEDNMAVYNREQVGSSFKPYILATAVAQGMNVQSSMLDGQDFVCIPPDSSLEPAKKDAYPDPVGYPSSCQPGWYGMSNDETTENGAFNAQDAMTNSVNTAYADLWHYVGGSNVVHTASVLGVNTKSLDQGGSGLTGMEHEAGVALGQASLTVGEQATMLSALDNGGTYHQIHIVQSISQGGSQYSLKLEQPQPIFNKNSVVNSQMDSEVQYAMEKVAYSGTATNAGMSDGRQIISKTGTTNTAESALFIGAIPQESLAVAMFTSEQDSKANGQTLNGLGNQGQGFGGTFPALIWHNYAQQMFLPMPAEQFPTPTFLGSKWTLAPSNLLKSKKKVTHKHGNGKGGNGPNPGGLPSAAPSPTATCAPGVITVACNPPTSNSGVDPTAAPTEGTGGFIVNAPDVTGSQAGAAAFGTIGGLPLTLLWVRRRQRRRRGHG
jgi:membrane peptidoglycan carboxypeptidase